MLNKNSPSALVTAIGNAIIDIIVKVDDSFLAENILFKGSMQLIEQETSRKILEKLNIFNINSGQAKIEMVAGGSACNSIAILSQLKVASRFIGNVANDDFGVKFRDSITDLGCDFVNVRDSTLPTAHSIILVSNQDGERTMLTYLGGASNIANLIVGDDFFKYSAYFYIEGYLWDKEQSIKIIKSMISKAKALNNKIIFSLSDSFCVDRHRNDFLNLINQDVDILFANQFEITSLLEIKAFNIDSVLKFSAQFRDKILVITLGNQGAMVFYNQQYFIVPPLKIVKPIDSTGAGDAFCAGFIYGLINNYDLVKSAELGNLIAGKIITKIGARLDNQELASLSESSFL